MRQFHKRLLCLLLVLLLAAAALTGCMQSQPANTEAPKTEAPKTEAQTEAPKTETQAPGTTAESQPIRETVTSIGEGDKLFYFDVTFSDGETSCYEVHTDAETVGEALVDLDLIAGEESAYGLYVKTIGDETLDYDTDGMYWAFYENGEFAMTGVDSTPVIEGASYAFVATKG